VLVLSRADLERLLRPADVIGALEADLRRAGQGRAVTPPRSALAIGGENVLLLMPAALKGDGRRARGAGHRRQAGAPGGGRGHVCKSVGWALEDLAAARLAYNRARAEGIGTEVDQ
jgi:ornithine cyclodeaminase/alanine dehydrogenase-like protein (mu-crystallin family)